MKFRTTKMQSLCVGGLQVLKNSVEAALFTWLSLSLCVRVFLEGGLCGGWSNLVVAAHGQGMGYTLTCVHGLMWSHIQVVSLLSSFFESFNFFHPILSPRAQSNMQDMIRKVLCTSFCT